MAVQKTSQSSYTKEFKWRVVEEVLSGRLNKEAARIAYGIKSKCAILYWMRQYSGNSDYRKAHTAPKDLSSMAQSKEQQELQERIKQLEEELRRANLRADLFQKMVEVAEDQLKINIKKKFGAQPSKPSGAQGNHQG